ncbi:response regulator transcription factor [Pedobacter sp. Leaf170]|uniref:response regulator transcription factor n=1 Tax=Pedobacter sp. Leaf170 TaxID=2876558 RepID=UPI001E6104FA|nr:response regulator [Pedobacter sp. Leaf170]
MKKTIYVLEDNEDILEVISETLKSEGHEVNGYTNTVSFKTAIRETKPDLCLIDVVLPDGHGINICEEIKLDRTMKNLPVILLTANAEIGKMKLRSRADDFIAKPFDLSDLIKRVNAQLQSN